MGDSRGKDLDAKEEEGLGAVEEDRSKLVRLLVTNIEHYITIDNPKPSDLLPRFLDTGLAGRVRAQTYLAEIIQFDNDRADVNELLKKVGKDYIEGVENKGIFKSSKVLHKIVGDVLCAHLRITDQDITDERQKKLLESKDLTMDSAEALSKDSIIIAEIIKREAHIDVKPRKMQSLK
ncbi:MAG: hypothetical protein ABI597_05165 [Gammaproteobacteria bacterium]